MNENVRNGWRRADQAYPDFWKLATGIFCLAIEVMRNVYVAIYILLLIAVVVGVDFIFLKHLFWLRLAVNIGIVLVFAAVYFALLKDL